MGPDQGEDTVEGEIVGAAHFQVGRGAVKLGGQFLEGTQIKLPGDQGLFLFQLGGPGEGLRVAGEGGGQPGSDLVNGLDLLQFRNAGTATESKNNEQKSQEAHIKQGRQVKRGVGAAYLLGQYACPRFNPPQFHDKRCHRARFTQQYGQLHAVKTVVNCMEIRIFPILSR